LVHFKTFFSKEHRIETQNQTDVVNQILKLLSSYGVDGLAILAIIGVTEFVKSLTKKKSKLYALLPLVLGIGSAFATTKEGSAGALYEASLKYAGTAMILYLLWSVLFEPVRKWMLAKFQKSP